MDEVFELFDHGLLSAGPPLFNHTTGQGVWHEERQSWNSAVKFGGLAECPKWVIAEPPRRHVSLCARSRTQPGSK